MRTTGSACKTPKEEQAKSKTGAFLKSRDIDRSYWRSRQLCNAALLGRYYWKVITGIPVSLAHLPFYVV